MPGEIGWDRQGRYDAGFVVVLFVGFLKCTGCKDPLEGIVSVHWETV